jgi:hypothetical protein
MQTVELRVSVPDNLTTPAKRVRGYWLKLLDFLFETRAEQVYARERLDLASLYDDQESELEQAAYAHMQQCPCECCRRLLPLLLRAERLDHLERESHERARAHVEAAGEYIKPTIQLADGALVAESSYSKRVAA